MNELWTNFLETMTPERVTPWLWGGLVILVGFFLARLTRTLFVRVVSTRLSAQHARATGNVVYFLVLGLAVIVALAYVGTDLKWLLGAAGVLTVALGFAAQTAVSNLISGLFLVGERTFRLGDLIQIAGTMGYVESIDLLSVKLRTFNNVLVRIPNESLLKSEITNLTHYPILRLDLTIGVAYKEDINRVKKVLLELADKNPYCLDEPKPLFFFNGFGDSAVNLRFSVWFTQENYWETQNRIQQEIKEALDRAGIEIPFPHRSLYTGAVTEPFPVRVVRDPAVAAAPESDSESAIWE